MTIRFLRLVPLFLLLPAFSACREKIEWKEFTSKDGAFSVSFPGDPEKEMRTTPAPRGTIDLHLFVAKDASAAYVLGYSDYPGDVVKLAGPEKLLEELKGKLVASIDGTMTSERSIRLEGYPGVELSADVPEQKLPEGGKYFARVYLVGNRLYQLSVLGSETDSTDVAAFLDSFHLLSAPAADNEMNQGTDGDSAAAEADTAAMSADN